MGGEDTELIFSNKIEVLDLSSCSIASSIPASFTYEKYELKISNSMPVQRRLFTVFGDLKHLNLENCSLNKQFYEMLKALYLIGVYPINLKRNEAEKVSAQLETLFLSKNLIKKGEAKVLKDSLSKMESLNTLNISKNKLGVSGCYSINEAIKNLTNLKYLDMFANLMDVDGARDLANLLEVNSSIEYLDIGYNRVRDEGLKTIMASLAKNKDCKLRVMCMRSNFLSDSACTNMLTTLKENSHLAVRSVFFKKNNITAYSLKSHYDQAVALSENFYSDIFEKMSFSDE